MYHKVNGVLMCLPFGVRRLESALRSSSRPVLHGAARIVQELGKSRASAVAIRGYGIDDVVQQDDMINPTADINKGDDEAGDAESGIMYDWKRNAGNTDVSPGLFVSRFVFVQVWGD
jgi:hypothetical protein